MAHHHLRPRRTVSPDTPARRPETPIDGLARLSRDAPLLSLALAGGAALLLGLTLVTRKRRR